MLMMCAYSTKCDILFALLAFIHKSWLSKLTIVSVVMLYFHKLHTYVLKLLLCSKYGLSCQISHECNIDEASKVINLNYTGPNASMHELDFFL